MNLTKLQNPLFYFLLGLMALMIVFSVLAIKDKGQEGYLQCVQQKCEEVSQDFCNKFREKNNCCMGAGGQMAQQGNELVCVFS